MIFRTHFLTLAGNDIENNSMCGVTPSRSTPFAVNLNVEVYLDNNVILSTLNLSSFTTQTTVVNGLTVVVTKINNVGLKIEVPFANIWDSGKLKIIAGKTNYYQYNNEFEIFGYDLGNNNNENNTLAQPITYNIDCDIVMMYDWSSSLSQQGHVHSKFAAYRQPFTNKVLVYNLVSTTGLFSYDANNIVNETSNTFFCEPEEIDILQTIKVGRYVNQEFVEDDTCTSNLVIPEFGKLILPFSNQVGCDSCATSCIILKEHGRAYTIIENNPSFQTFWKDDTIVNPYNSMTLTYELYDLYGNLTYDQTYTIDTTYLFTPDALNYPFNFFELTELGDHVLKVTLSVQDVFSCTNVIPISGCLPVKIEKVGCNDYKFTNVSLVNQDITIYNLDEYSFDGSTPSEIVEERTLLSLEEFTITLPDGLYGYKTDLQGGNVFGMALPVFCNLETCLLNYIKDIMCGGKPKCSCGGSCGGNCKGIPAKVYEFNSILALAYLIFTNLNSNYYFNRVLTQSDFTSPIKDLYIEDFNYIFKFKELLDKAKDYCEECNTKVTVSSSSTIKSKGCGCS